MAAELASRQLERVLYLVPQASGPEGASIAELAAEMEVSPERILRDIEEVTARDYYHPAGWVADLQISVEKDTVTVWTTGELQRPVRLSPREALALALGLRLLADGTEGGRREELLSLAGRLDQGLASVPAEPMTAGFALDGGDRHGNGLLALVRNLGRDCSTEPCEGVGEDLAQTLPVGIVQIHGAGALIAEALRDFGHDHTLR